MSFCCGVDLWGICEVSCALVKRFKRHEPKRKVKFESVVQGTAKKVSLEAGCSKVGWFNPELVENLFDVFKNLEC